MRSTSHAIELEVDSGNASPRAVRRAFAVHFATRPGLDDLLLCLSEVLTNAVLHAGPPIRIVGGIILGGTIRVEVTDGSTAPPLRRTADSTSITGRGLHLLDELTSDWGVDITGTGKTVWFEINGAAA